MKSYKLLLRALLGILLFSYSLSFIGCGKKNIEPNNTKADAGTEPNSTSETFTYLEVNANGEFVQQDKLFYGIGVNYFNAFTRELAAYPKADTSYSIGLKYLADNKIPFIRFSANGFWPDELSLYRNNKSKYFELMDKFVATAERYKVGLIPSLFWMYSSISDLYDEPVRAWGDVNSQTIAYMKQFTTEFVTRYKNSPAFWGWEFSNEVNLKVDPVGRTDRWYYSAVNPSQGTPASRPLSDTITTDQFLVAVNEFAKIVRQIDTKRPIFNGNGLTSPNAYKKYYDKIVYPYDNVAQWKQVLALQNSHVNTIEIHPYAEQHEGSRGLYFYGQAGATIMQIITAAKEAAVTTKKPLFIGEFGVSEKYAGDKNAKLNDYINAIVENNVQLSALWVYDFFYQENEWNVTPTNNRNYQLTTIINANKILSSK